MLLSAMIAWGLMMSTEGWSWVQYIEHHTESNLWGTYGQEGDSGGGTCYITLNAGPPSYGDRINMYAQNGNQDDYARFHGTHLTIGNRGNTNFVWYTEFGDRAVNALTIDIVGGENLFDHQNIYFGAPIEFSGRTSGKGKDGDGQDVTVNFIGGTNKFTQRAIFGGPTHPESYDNYDKGTTFYSGDSNVTFSGGETTFSYHPTDIQHRIDSGEKYDGVKDSKGYNYNLHYFGVYFSAMAVNHKDYKTIAGETNVQFTGGKNTFDTTVHFGGNYDLTVYGSVNGSSDDQDVTYGGKNTVHFAGGLNTFNYRTTFGAPDSHTTVDFTDGETTFAGSPQTMHIIDAKGERTDLDKLYGYYNLSEGMARLDENSVPNTYRGQDLPYVFFGGKDLEQVDIDAYNYRSGSDDFGSTPSGEPVTTVTINAKTRNHKVLSFDTTGFFGGADERWLAGDQYVYDAEKGTYAPRFYWFEAKDSPIPRGASAIRKDNGAATLNLKNGNLTLGVANTMQVVDEMSGKMDEHGHIVSDYYVTGVRDRYEQVRLIGAAAGSKFNATGGRITFEVKEHKLGDLTDYDHGYFHELDETIDGVQVLETGMIVFDNISISSNTDIALKNVSKLLVNAKEDTEYVTNPTFVDTTDSDAYQTEKYDWVGGNSELTADGLASNIDLDGLAAGSDEKLQIGRHQYDKWFYNITVEDVVDGDTGEGVQTAAARLRIQMKNFDDAFDIGNFGLNKDKIKCVLSQDPDKSKVYQALDYIISTSESGEAAAENFDQLIGASYASMANHQIHRLTNMNTLIANQLMASDVAMKNAKAMSFCQCGLDPCSCGAGNACRRNWTAWANFHGMSGKTGMDNYFSGYNSESYEAMFAIEYNDCEGFHAGIYFNYGESNFGSSADLGWTNLDTTDYTLGLYMKWLALRGGGYGMLNTNIAWSDYESERYFIDAPENYAGEYDGLLPSIYYERGWVWFCNNNCTINPYFSLQYAYFHSGDFTESGYDAYGYPSDLALSVSEVDHHSLRTFVGLRLSHDFWLGRDHDRRLTLRLNGAWIHDLLGDCTPTILTKHQVDPCGLWNVRGNDGGRDWANIGVGLDFNICKRISALVDYNVFVNEYTTLHSGMASLRFEF